ncbi:MAG: beta-lactamase family protein [Chloroflexi bacterium]|nr:beta-lactamase family protein [Chloroflexota bacterium]
MASTSDGLFQTVTDEIAAGMARLPIPGLAVGVSYEGQTYTAGFGVTSIENPLPVTADTLFQTGSITKTFTATILMRLLEQGRLELDAPIRTYLPDFQLSDESVVARATIRHLLTHTGGWLGDYFNDFGYGDDAQQKMVAEIGKLPQWTPLGEVWSYCNTGFNIAGRIIEVITCQTYEAAVKSLLLDPLDMKMSFYFPHDVMVHRFAVGHQVIDRQPRVARPWPIGRAGHPVGGVVSTVNDLLKYARFHLSDGQGLLKPDTLKMMQTPIVQGSGLDVFGLSWFITPIGDTPVVRHGGATHGFTADFTLVPSRQFAIVTLTNSDQGSVLYGPLRANAIKQYLGIEWPNPPHIARTPEQLAQYVGDYDAPEDWVELRMRDGELWLQQRPKGGFPTPDVPPGETPPPTRLAFWGEDKIIALDEPLKGARGEFLRGADGAIAWFRFSSRVHRPISE